MSADDMLRDAFPGLSAKQIADRYLTGTCPDSLTPAQGKALAALVRGAFASAPLRAALDATRAELERIERLFDGEDVDGGQSTEYKVRQTLVQLHHADASRANVEKMRAVVEAAKDYAAIRRPMPRSGGADTRYKAALSALFDALDALAPETKS